MNFLKPFSVKIIITIFIIIFLVSSVGVVGSTEQIITNTSQDQIETKKQITEFPSVTDILSLESKSSFSDLLLSKEMLPIKKGLKVDERVPMNLFPALDLTMSEALDISSDEELALNSSSAYTSFIGFPFTPPA